MDLDDNLPGRQTLGVNPSTPQDPLMEDFDDDDINEAARISSLHMVSLLYLRSFENTVDDS